MARYSGWFLISDESKNTNGIVRRLLEIYKENGFNPQYTYGNDYDQGTLVDYMNGTELVIIGKPENITRAFAPEIKNSRLVKIFADTMEEAVKIMDEFSNSMGNRGWKLYRDPQILQLIEVLPEIR